MKHPPLGKALLPVFILLLSGTGFCAQEADPPKKKLIWNDECAFTYNDEKHTPFEQKVDENTCNVLNVQARAAFDKKTLENQQNAIENAQARAKTSLAAWQADHDAILARTNPANLKSLKGQVRKAKAQGYRSDILAATGKWQNNDVVRGAQLRGRGDKFMRDVEARMTEINSSLSGTEIDKEIKHEAEALKAKSASLTTDGDSATGRANAKVTKATGSGRDSATTEILEGKGYDPKQRKHTGGGHGSAQSLELMDVAAAPAVKGVAATHYNRDKIPEMAIPAKGHGAQGDHAAPAPDAHGKPGAAAHGEAGKEQEGWYVKKALHKAEMKLEDTGTNMMISAQKHDAEAQKALKTASDACAKGGYWDCAKAKASGYTSYVGHKAADVGNTVGAFGVASAEGVTRGLQNKGPEATILKVGAVTVAGIATGGAALVAVGGTVGGAALAGGTGALVAHGVTSGVQTVGSANTGAQAALGGAEIALSAAAPAIGKGIGHLATKVAPGAVAAASSMVTRGASMVLGKAAVAAEASVVGSIASKGLTAAAETSGHWAPHIATHVAEHTAATVVEKGVHAGTGWVLGVEHDEHH